MKKTTMIRYILSLTIFAFIPIWHTNASFVDTGKVEAAWLQWTNDLRVSQKLPEYTIDSRLTTTATERSQTAQKRGYIDHKRNKKDGYYNYKKIEQWFKNRGLIFEKIHRGTFSESIGYGYVSCKQEDCTDELIQATKSTWNMYMAEKNKKSRPHYNALIHKYFTTMGVGIVYDAAKREYYITIHYAAKIRTK